MRTGGWFWRGRRPFGLLLTALLGWSAAALAAPGLKPQVIYGNDDRQEVFGLTGALAAAADGSVALVSSSSVVGNGNGTSKLVSQPLSASLKLCAGERFAAQPTAAYCSGVLVGPDIVATAGHCITGKSSLASTRFVFGYRMTDDSTAQVTLPNSEIYRGAQILARQLNSAGADFTLVRLDRKVTQHQPQPVGKTGRPATGTPLYVIGYPYGLPEKIAAGATVRSANASYFTANLDTYAGNSGSPVFDARTNTVIGILVRGATDFVWRGSCYSSNLLANSVGSEDSTNTSTFASFIPKR